MIKEKDVIRMKLPFPSIKSGLASQAHMYICNKGTAPDYGFVKCQTLKPYMLGRSDIAHFIDERPDIQRNPFRQTSRIDCDKLFATSSVQYDERLKTTSRPDICQELYDDVMRELIADGYETFHINEADLMRLNHFITKI